MTILYGEQTKKCVETMSFSGKSLGDYPEYVKNLLLVKAAAAKANVAVNALQTDIGDAIGDACKMAIHAFDKHQYPVDVCHGGGGIGINMNVNEVIGTLASKLGGIVVDPIAHVNRSQSTSDVCHTAIRLTIRYLLDQLLSKLSVSITAMRNKQQEFSGIRTISRTCMMDAMAMDFGDRFSGYVDVLVRRRDAIVEIRKSLLTVNLGGTVIGSGEGAAPGYREVIVGMLQDVYGQECILSENGFDDAQNMDELVALSQSLSNLAQVLVKISKDFRFLGSGPEAGIGELKIPKTQSGSSFFPGKVNPVLPEMMMQCGFLVSGLTQSVELAHLHGETDLNVFEEFAGVLVMDQMKVLTKAITQFTEHALIGLSVDRDRCLAHATSLVPMVTDLADEYGYEAVSVVIQNATETGISVTQALRDAFATAK